MNFVACVSWVKKGIAKEVPDKVSLSQDELKRLVESAKLDVADADQDTHDDDDGNENEEDDAMEAQDEETSDGHATDEEEDIAKKYGLDTYDDEDDDAVNDTANSLAALTVFPSNESDPWLDPNQVDDSDEEDNYRIRPSDNLIAVGHVEEDCSILEIYVHNTEEEEETLYVHHDIVLPAFPMCLEWLDFDPSETNPVNYIAVGDMTPVIQVWDIDVVDTLEPAYKLGKKVKKKKAAKQKLEPGDTIGHTDGVLDIKWNRFARFVLASGSADHTVCLWDLNKAVPVTSLTHHTEKVQALQWHPCEMKTLLTSSCDKTVNLYDCQVPDEFKRWNVDGEVESLLWNHFDPYYFLVGTDKGFVYSFDVRTSNSVFTLKAHNDAITGMSLSPQIPGCLITASIDKTVKVWDVQNNSPQFVVEKDLKLGTLYTVASCPDSPCTIACGGDNKSNSFRVLDLRTSKPFCDHFSERLNHSNLVIRPDQQLQTSSAETTSPEASTSSAGGSGNGANISENSQTIPFPHIGKKPKVKKMKKTISPKK